MVSSGPGHRVPLNSFPPILKMSFAFSSVHHNSQGTNTLQATLELAEGIWIMLLCIFQGSREDIIHTTTCLALLNKVQPTLAKVFVRTFHHSS